MNEVSALQHNQAAAEDLAVQWHAATCRPASFEDEEVPARQEILQRGFDAPLRAVTMALHRIARSDPATRDVTAPAIRRGLIALLSHYPVYRGYHEGERRSAVDQAAFDKALAAARRTSPHSAHFVLDHLNRWLGGDNPPDRASHALWKMAGTLFHQLSAPVAAKSVEDTAFYRYGRLLSRNDVGFDAPRLGGSVQDFHQACLNRLATFPDAMLATATHDHKRGEDLRARLAVVSEMPDAWADFIAQARALPCRTRPDPGDEIMLYQMIIGAWPLLLDPADRQGLQAFAERLAGWQQKALREAKLRTDWTAPDAGYEETAREFLFSLLSADSPFLRLAKPFVDRIAPAGAVNGLVQATLKMTVPGMPDFFQGTDFWDFSLVDPDNRRPVDYGARWTALADGGALPALASGWRDGRVKQALVRTILTFRRHRPALFARGDYVPLSITGGLADRMVAFARIGDQGAVIVVVPRLAHDLLRCGDQIGLEPAGLADSAVILPERIAGRKLRCVLTGDEMPRADPQVPLPDLLSQFPLAVLHAVESP
jgi:malto-oligosyltrehalose synthase